LSLFGLKNISDGKVKLQSEIVDVHKSNSGKNRVEMRNATALFNVNGFIAIPQHKK